jgi:hypothetical protein
VLTHTLYSFFLSPNVSVWRDYNVYYISTGRFHKKKCPAHDFKHPFGIGGEIGRRKFGQR